MEKSGVISLLLICVYCGVSLAGNFREKIFNTPCALDQFKCLNGACISRDKHCNNKYDCADNSDEQYCNTGNCPTVYPFYRCPNYKKCIPAVWRCDEKIDCPRGHDEDNCAQLKDFDSRSVTIARKKALRWINTQAKNRTSTDRWGAHVQRTSVALYLADPTSFVFPNGTRREMAYEVTIQLLSKFALRKLKDVPTSDLSSHINALLVTCLDPRKFHSVDLVRELRSRVSAQNNSIPYDILTLCNAGEKMTKKDVDKLTSAFRSHRRELWTETQAIAVMALVCVGNQPGSGSNFPLPNIPNLTDELKKKQHRNGTVENTQTTALVMQALFAVELQADEDNFDEEKALQQILREQREDGSFGSLLNTYYTLPVLGYKSMVNISSAHCGTYIKDEDTGLQDLLNQRGPRMHVKYSLWIGDEKDVERTLKLRVPVNTSFYGVMETAGDLDAQFRFQYTVKNGKPYVNAVSGIQDDVESGKFWFPHIFNGTNYNPVTVSPAELIPKNNDHISMWYRRGSWIE